MIALKPVGNIVLGLSIALLAACQPPVDNAADTDQLQVNAHLEVARLYQQQGQYRAAEIEALNALRIKPSGSDVRSFFASLYYEIGDVNNAKNFVASLFAANPRDPDIALIMAELELRSGVTFRAESILNTLQDLSSEDEAQKQLLLGNILVTRESFNEARAAYAAALASDQALIEAYIEASKLEIATGNRITAQEFIDRASRVAPADLDLLIWRGQFAMLMGQFGVAEEALFEALDAMASYDTMTSRRFMVTQNVQAMLQAQQRNGEALRYAELIANSPQGQYLASFENALALYNQGEFEEAEAAILGLMTISPNDVNSQVLMGMTQYAQQDYEAAAEVLSSLVESETITPSATKSLAAVYLRQNRISSAIQTLTLALDNYPEDASLLAMLGMSHQAAGEYDRALEYLQQALTMTPNDPRTLYALGQTYYLQLDFDAARETLTQLVELDPNFAGAKSSLIGIYLLEEDFSGAREQVQLWLDQQAGSTLNTVLAGWVAFADGSYPEARQLFESIIAVDPQNVQSRLFLARIHLLSDNFEAAMDQYEVLLQSASNNIEAISGLIAAATLAGQEFEAVTLVTELANSDPENVVAPLLLSQYHLRQDNLEDSQRWAELAWGREPSDTTRSNLANVYAAMVAESSVSGLTDAATEILNNSVASDAEMIASLTSLIARAIEEQNYQEARTIARTMQANYPDAPQAYVSEGDVLTEMGDNQAALAVYQRAWEMQHTTSIGARVHVALTAMNRVGDARQFLDEWLAEFPEDGAANILAGIDSLNASNEAQALAHFELAYQQQPTNPIVLNNLAWLYRDSDMVRGIELARQAVQYRDGYADALDTLGWLLHLNGDSAAALDYLQQALELAPDSRAIAEHVETVSALL